MKTLESAGLSNAQSIIYLTLIEVGITKVGVIIEQTNLQSSVVHNNLNKLIEKGLVSFVMVGKIKHYQAAEPEVFLNFLEDQKKQIDERKKEINKLLPKLKLQKELAKQKTDVQVFRGRKGFQTAYLEEYEKLSKGQTAQFIGLPSEFQEDKSVHDFYLKINNLVEEKKCHLQGLGSSGVRKIWKSFYSNQKTYSLRYLDEEFPWGMMIFKDTILLALWGDDPIIIKIKNLRFRDRALKYFNTKWKSAKK